MQDACKQARWGPQAGFAEPGTPASAHTHAAPHATPALAPGTQPRNPSNRASTLACLPSKPTQTAQPQAAPAAQRGIHKRAAGSATPAGVSAASGRRSSARAPVAAAGSLCACGHSNLHLSCRCRAGRSRRAPHSPGASGAVASTPQRGRGCNARAAGARTGRRPRRRCGPRGHPGRAPRPARLTRRRARARRRPGAL